MQFRWPSRRLPARSGITHRAILLVLPLVLIIPALAYSVFPGLSGSGDGGGPLMHVVERGDFLHEVTERGNVESASNIEIRCEVQAQNSAGTRILKIIPEGTYVQKGETLVELDSSALENDRMKQQITRSTSEAQLIQAKNDYDTAVKTREEYELGKYVLEKQTIDSKIKTAQETLRRAKDYYDYSLHLAKGYITQVQLEADEFAWEKAKIDLDAANQEMKVLQDFTHAKMLMQLDADIATAKAKWDAQKATFELDEARLKLIEDQVAKCIIKAPEAGQVVYAQNESSRFGGNQETMIEEGATVRERQVIIRLPDPKRMQVKAKVNESKIAMVREGQPAAIRLDAFPEAELTGVVEKVNEYPAQASFWASNIKEYDTVVRILNSPVDLRPGLTAEVKIRVAQQSNMLQVPIQAILGHAGRHYCVLRDEDGDGWTARPIKLGLSNEKFAVVSEGLEPGESVALAATTLRNELNLPQMEGEEPKPLRLASASEGLPEAAPGEGKGAVPSGEKKRGAGRDNDWIKLVFEENDKNKDGKLDKSELPERLASMLATADANHDGALDLAEITLASATMGGNGKRGPRGEGKGGPGAGEQGFSSGAPGEARGPRGPGGDGPGGDMRGGPGGDTRGGPGGASPSGRGESRDRGAPGGGPRGPRPGSGGP